VVSGEWRDVDAAIHAAAIRTEMAVVHASAQGPDRWVYTLRTARDEPVQAEIWRLPPGYNPKSVSDIAILCRVGRLGDPAREGAFIDAFGHRLARLTGVEARRLGR
jgi:hypothetical protein